MKPILLVEDNADDVFFMRRALKGAGIVNPLIVIEDGESAINFLKNSLVDNDQTNSPLPGLVLLDLHLPFKSGFEVLSWIRSQEALRELPVVPLITSKETSDADTTTRLGATMNLLKPPTAAALAQLNDSLQPDCLEFASTAGHAR